MVEASTLRVMSCPDATAVPLTRPSTWSSDANAVSFVGSTATVRTVDVPLLDRLARRDVAGRHDDRPQLDVAVDELAARLQRDEDGAGDEEGDDEADADVELRPPAVLVGVFEFHADALLASGYGDHDHGRSRERCARRRPWSWGLA